MTRVIENIDVSVVIAAWNSAEFINTAIFSALNQVDINVEVIVVDDLSTDNTISVVQAINDPRITLIKNKSNTGPGGARNLGFDAANGTWIAVLDSDDEMLPDRLSKLLSLKGEETDIILDNFYVRNNKGDILTPYYSNKELPLGPFSLQYLIGTNLIFSKVKSTGYLKPLFKRSFVEKHSIRYWPEVRVGEDYYFLASCLVKSTKAEVVPYIGYIYNVRGGSISSVLRLQHIQTLLSSDGKFNEMYNLDTPSVDAQVTRNKNLLRAYKYLEIVKLLKERKLLKALIYSIFFPKSSFLLYLPILKRLNLFRRGYNG
ncbi:glycosyltransferase family 2 protein [Shewanella livingstonensis]|uniref:Glycosyltransferase family 2 protein n=1 Tax=Shewanella livingstonensis TaxID=150120 RepID=A0A3G8LY74_9GAMM|nr:glycosyltransferase family 2 protein [Shewanella livingstonensis]AZG73842.1 glycosyltransferase family 2 protein [Shewanella livingstonensis]